VAFDTNIVDLSEKCEDPIDLLFGFTLGGGTDIEKSIKYCSKYIENPKKTIFFLLRSHKVRTQHSLLAMIVPSL